MSYYNTTIEEIVENLEMNKVNKCKTAVLLGAGVSETAGIPTAKGIMNDIEKKYPNTASKCSNKTYQDYMQLLAPDQRRNLIENYVDNAKINPAHLYLGTLIKENYIDRVLTTNFDNLVIRSLGLFNIYPAIYDLVASQTFIPEETAQLSLFYLLGQRNGYDMLNTESEMKRLSKATYYEELFRDTAKQRSWIVVGYSGENDPIFTKLAEIEVFKNKLFWIGYKEDPKNHVLQRILTPEEKYGCYLKGYDADYFFRDLVRKLKLPEPQILSTPFSHLKEEIENIDEFLMNEPVLSPDGLENEGKMDLTATAKKWTNIAIEGFEKGRGFQDLKGVQKETINREKIIHQSQNIRFNYIFDIIDSQLINEIKSSKSKKAIDNLVHSISNESLLFAKRARTKEGKDADILFNKSIEKLNFALDINPDDYEVVNNLGTIYVEIAKKKKCSEVKDFQMAFSNFSKSLLIKPKYYKALYNWGTVLMQIAQKKEGEERDNLLSESLSKFKLIPETKQKDPKILNNYTIILLELAKLKDGEEKEKLLKQAIKKSETLHFIKNGKSYKALLTWGTGLLELSKTSGIIEKEKLIKQAIDKIKNSLNLNNNHPDAINNLGLAMLELAKMKIGKKKESLLRQAIDKFILVEEGKTPEKAYNLACAYSILGEKENAIMWLEKFLSIKKTIPKSILLSDEDFNNIKNSETFINLLNKYCPD